MAQVGTNEFKAGMKVEVEGEPYIMVSVEFFQPGKGQPFTRTKLKHLKTGRVVERTFKSGERIDLADVEEMKMRLLYKEPNGVVFMDDNSFEQITVSNNAIGENAKWLMEEMLYDILIYKRHSDRSIPAYVHGDENHRNRSRRSRQYRFGTRAQTGRHRNRRESSSPDLRRRRRQNQNRYTQWRIRLSSLNL